MNTPLKCCSHCSQRVARTHLKSGSVAQEPYGEDTFNFDIFAEDESLIEQYHPVPDVPPNLWDLMLPALLWYQGTFSLYLSKKAAAGLIAVHMVMLTSYAACRLADMLKPTRAALESAGKDVLDKLRQTSIYVKVRRPC